MGNGGPPNTSGGNSQPSNGGSIEHQVTALEARLDAVLPTLATKADLAELRTDVMIQLERVRIEIQTRDEKLRADIHADMERLSARLTRWMLATTLSLIVAFATLFAGTSYWVVETLPSKATPTKQTRVGVTSEARQHPEHKFWSLRLESMSPMKWRPTSVEIPTKIPANARNDVFPTRWDRPTIRYSCFIMVVPTEAGSQV